jgi:exopolysaccharide biosynthesis WecB/TagA/CpsF family protein
MRHQHDFDAKAASLATPLFDLSLLDANRHETAEALVNLADQGVPMVVNFVNAHCVNLATRHTGYAATLRDSDALLPDGSGIRLAARLAGTDTGDNLNGTDLFPHVCERAAARGTSIFLLGGGPGVAAAAAAAMQARFPDLIIAGTQHGYFGDTENNAVVDMINASGAAILFVGFGVPRQELWIAGNRDRIDVPLLLGVGGLFDYYSGRITRAPMLVRRLGCKWIWRLWQEPRRLAGRYLVGNVVFVGHALRHAYRATGLAAMIGAGIKRCLDLFASALICLLLAPVSLGVALAIWLEDRGPALFRQTRIGANGRPFTMLKFRSMHIDAEARRVALVAQSERDSVCFKMRRDPRITRVGAIIRRFSLDELPQIVNVLTGDMSLVGPRPALPSEVATYTGRSWQRLGGKPGITCIWQVSGRAEIAFDQQVEMDISYLRRRSLVTDIGLLLRTIPAVIGGRGAY